MPIKTYILLKDEREKDAQVLKKQSPNIKVVLHGNQQTLAKIFENPYKKPFSNQTMNVIIYTLLKTISILHKHSLHHGNISISNIH